MENLDIGELTGGIERLNGAVHVEKSDGLPKCDVDAIQHCAPPLPVGAHYCDAVENGRLGPLLGLHAGNEPGEKPRQRHARPAHCGHRLHYAFLVPAIALKTSFSPSSATSIWISSPAPNSPNRILSDNGSSTYRWIARFSGRAPKLSS